MVRQQVVTTPPQSPPSHERFAAAVLAELYRRDPDGTRLPVTADVSQEAALAAERVLDTAAQWVEHLGAFYDTDGVRALLGGEGAPVTRQAVHKRRGLLALMTGNGRVVYPAVQFRGRRLAPGLERVLAELPEEIVSRWTVASWLASPEAGLNGERPIDVLFDADEGAIAAVVTCARQWATALAA